MKRRPWMIIVAAGVVLAMAWFMLLWQPKSREMADARERGEQASSTLDQLELRLARLQALSKQRAHLDVEYNRLRTAVPDRPAVAEFILDTNAAASAAGVEFVSVAPQEPQPGEGAAAAVELAINVSGGYHQVLDFVDRLMNLTRVVVIDSFSVTPQGEATSQSPELVVGLGGRMFTTAAAAPEGVATTPTSTVAVSE